MKLLPLLLLLLLPSGLARAVDQPLPLDEVPAPARRADAPLVIFLSGDGGWAEFVREISTRLAGDGWDVVGFDLRKYLWTPRTPAEATAAVARIILEYDAKWHHSHLVIAGFSRGADLAPFVVNRLPAEMRNRISLVVLLSPGQVADFEFRIGNFIRPPHPETQRPLLPEIQRLQPPWVLLHGKEDDETIKLPITGTDPARVFGLPGNHHLGWDYATIHKLIVAAYRGATAK
jgi:type IV secretory pathway VirJ component